MPSVLTTVSSPPISSTSLAAGALQTPSLRAAATGDHTAVEDISHTKGGGGWKPALCVVLAEVFNTGTILLGKVAVDGGMFVFSLLCYRSILGAIFTFPFALILESGKWKELGKKALLWLFINAFVGYSVPMALYYYGLRDTKASYAVIFSSLTPLFTFVLSILLSMENLRLKSKQGSAKVIGALVCFGGALLISLYNGEEIIVLTPLIKGITSSGTAGRHHLRGTLLLLGTCISNAIWYPIQVKVLSVYPWKHWSSVLTCVLGGLQTSFVGIIMKRDKLSWQIGWDIRLLTIVYSAALGTEAKYWLNLYAVEKRGPVFPPMFSALSTVFTIILGTLLLGESLTVGSLMGSALVFIGLYGYLYGKAKEVRAKPAPAGPSNKESQSLPNNDPTKSRNDPVSFVVLDMELDAKPIN
uniref:Uncharacterized protein n=1 Tax=Avena sativa TaxID=4498 RepID=A0ACD5WRD5_AVESA